MSSNEVNDKLKFFYDTTITEISKKGEGELFDLKESLEKEFEEYKIKKTEENNTLKQIRLAALKRDFLQSFSAKKLEIRTRETKELEKLKNALFDEIAQKLSKFRENEKYILLLEEKISKAKEIAGECTIEVFISPKDEGLARQLEKSAGLKLEFSDEITLGGIQAKIPEKNLFVDYSFRSKLEEIRAEYVL